MKHIISIIIILFFQQNVIAQFNLGSHRKNTFYLFWGYNRSYFSTTNLHFTGPNYDFTLYNLKATDRPIPFGWVYFNPETISIPQYNIRLGYFITDRISLSLGMDHMKYVITQNQATTISGVITEEASLKYAGNYLNQAINLDADLLIFEHTNGFNLTSFDLEYTQPLFSFLNKKISLNWNFGFGGIWIITKTDVKVMGDGLDNDFHISGFTLAGKTGPKIDFWNRLFLAAEIKGGYASLPWVLIKNDAPEIGDHNVNYLEWYIVFGTYFKLWKRKNSNHLK